jgi:hypothetical protein
MTEKDIIEKEIQDLQIAFEEWTAIWSDVERLTILTNKLKEYEW